MGHSTQNGTLKTAEIEYSTQWKFTSGLDTQFSINERLNSVEMRHLTQ